MECTTKWQEQQQNHHNQLKLKQNFKTAKQHHKEEEHGYSAGEFCALSTDETKLLKKCHGNSLLLIQYGYQVIWSWAQ
eukprot:487283-Ditylum_brightwellii.AAC.1